MPTLPPSLSPTSMWSNPIVSAETDALETTPLLDSERSSRHDGDPQKRVRYHSSNSSISPSSSRPPVYRRSFSAETLPSHIAVHGGRTPSPDISSQQHQPLLSRSGPFYNLRQWVELRLENSGSVARDHLASERTFLAYMRTSLAIASSGVALTQLFSAASSHKLSVYVRPLGASIVIVGLLVLFIGLSSSVIKFM